jgi:hypothetical protein
MQAGIPYCTFIVPLKVTCQTLLSLLECMAGTTGLEPATSAVTGQRSNQLSYVPSAISIAAQIADFTVFSYCPLFRLFPSFPPDVTEFREKWTVQTASENAKSLSSDKRP